LGTLTVSSTPSTPATIRSSDDDDEDDDEDDEDDDEDDEDDESCAPDKNTVFSDLRAVFVLSADDGVEETFTASAATATAIVYLHNTGGVTSTATN